MIGRQYEMAHGRQESVNFNPETLALLKETLDDAGDCLRPDQQATMLKTTRLVVAALTDISGRQ